MAAVHVRLNQVAHLRVDALLDLLGEKAFTDLLEVRQGSATKGLGGPSDELLKLQSPQLMLKARGDQADQFPNTHIAAAKPLTGEDDGGETRDQRAVEVEEGTYFGPGRAGHDFGHRTGESRVSRGVTAAHE